MKEERSGVRRAGDFLAGKGFYVILFVCIAVIGVSAWILLFTGIGDDGAVMESGEPDYSAMEYSPDLFGGMFDPGESEDAFSGRSETSPLPEAVAPEVPATPPQSSPSQSIPPPAKSEAPSEAPKEESAAPTGHAKTLSEMTYAWPVIGDVERGFAVDGLIYNRTMADWRAHPGIDIATAVGTKVQAIADGTVVDVYKDDLMGTTVIIDHGNSLRSIYSNLAATPVVSEGDSVTLGAVIGAVGDTALGEIGEVAHLHLEMTLDGDAVDPVAYLPKR